MTHVSPIIQDGVLTDLLSGSPVQIVVDSPDWYAWLQTASTFTFRGEEGFFTAHRERAGNRRGRAYWRAYRTSQGKLHRAYLGQSEELTIEQLQSVAAMLASKGKKDNMLDLAGREGGPFSEASSTGRTPPRRARTVSIPRETDLSKSSLPVPLTALIGRDQEVQTICGLLSQPEVRLLTITGTGGVGKTRLALEAARVLQASFADGICFVPLASVCNPAHVIPAIAQALGLWEVADLPVEEQVCISLHERHLLLLLDNFEQVVKGAPQLISLLASCPRLRILATSRAALHLSGEREFPVLPLTVPDLTQMLSPEALIQQASARLFVLRTQAIQPAFHVSPDNARAIAEICVRLDGLPLAIELAAARSKLLPPQALLKRLSHRLEVLTSGAQDLPIRQQTLRNTFQWSYDLLTTEEQRLFRWLSIFVGGCTLKAAEAVCQAGSEQILSVLEGVASLLDKSLLQQTEREGEEPRLVMLETLRAFGLECLERQGELEAARQAHAHYYLKLAEQAEPYLLSSEQLQWFDQLEQELGNLWAILQAVTAGSVEERELALCLAAALRTFWIGRGHLSEGRNVLEQLLAGAGAIEAPIRLKALNALATIQWSQNDARGLELVANEALALARRQGDRWHITRAIIHRGTAMMQERRDYTEAQACLGEALASARVLGDRYLLLVALAALGRLAWFQRDFPRAIAWYEECLIQCRALGEKFLMSMGLVGLARAEMSQGYGARARALLEESLALYQALGNTWWIATVLNLLGQLAFQQGELNQAEAFLRDCIQLALQAGDQRNAALSRLLLGGLAARREEFGVARQWYEEGLATAIEVGYTSFIASGLKGLGCVAAAQGLSGWAVVLWGTVESLCESGSVPIPGDLYKRMVALMRSQLGESAFEEFVAVGRTMTPAQALAAHEAFAPQDSHSTRAAPGSAPHALTRYPSYPAALTARQVEVLRLVAQGLTNAQIADQLFVSPHTVNAHVRSIFNKLDVSSRNAATRFAFEHNLL